MGVRVKVVFIGTSAFGLKVLEAASEVVEIVGAVAAPKTFPISYRPQGVTNVLHADVPAFCEAREIPCQIIDGTMPDPPECDAFLVAGWYHMVPRRWRSVAPAYGLHASLLPDYAGGAPLVWAIINGEKRTGISLFQLGDGVDDGPIVGQRETEITASDTIATLYERIEGLGVELVRELLPDILSRPHVPQDFSKRRVFPQRGPEDGLIEWHWSAEQVHNFVRAQTHPYPGAFVEMDGGTYRIWETEPFAGSYPVGVVTNDAPYLMVGCGEGSVALKDFTFTRHQSRPTASTFQACR
jgi:methionyl-tRNA formyltransferase